MKLFYSILLVMLVATSVSAKPKTQTFDSPRDRVFTALTKVIAQHYVITFADEKNFTVSFHTGVSLTSNGMSCTASVDGDGASSTVSINVQKTNGQVFAWGAGDRITKDTYKWIEEVLAQPTP